MTHSPVVNLPNAITLSRLVLTGVFVAGTAAESTLGHWIALISFVVAAVSDFLDGWLARKLNLVTSMGKLLDPLADKILVSAAFIYLSAEGLCPVWVTVLIIGREFLVTGLRQIAMEAGQVLAADNLGKWKTTFQLAFCITGLIHFAFLPLSSDNAFVAFCQSFSNPQSWFLATTMYVALILTVWSGWNYTWNSRGLLKSK